MKIIKKIKAEINYMVRSLRWLRALNSPFKRLTLDIYYGKIRMGCPYFLPRTWKKDKTKSGWITSVSIKWFGINYCSLGFKTKWGDTDYRFEWSPMLSIVILNRQLHFTVYPKVIDCADHYWEAWLYYDRHTSGTKKERIKQTIDKFPLVYTATHYDVFGKKVTETVVYYDRILKKKYLKYITTTQ